MLLHEKLKSWRLILASQSPRRRQLLSEAGLGFELAPRFECEECFPPEMPADEVAEYLSRLKSEAYPLPLGGDDILLTADTVVVLGDRVLGKPADAAEAVEMIADLSGKEHKVITGVTLRSDSRSVSFSSLSKVRFRSLSREEIEYYVEVYAPMDKAGAYGIQGLAGRFVKQIRGDYNNVVGLPVAGLYQEVKQLKGEI